MFYRGNKILNQSKSFKNYRWVLQEPDTVNCLNLVQKFNIKELTARLLINRGIDSPEKAENFLSPKLKIMLPDPGLLKDMEKAVERIVTSIKTCEKVMLFTDYDVDGATSAALLRLYLQRLNCSADVYVPCRFKEGYGPNVKAFRKIVEEGYTLIIILDCGTTSFGPIDFLLGTGTDAIVIDHHLSLSELPKALAVINPNRLDQDFPYKDIAAVAVVFLVLVEINKVLRNSNYPSSKINLLEYLDLVALGTVCDVMPLKGINRAFVTQGLKIIEKQTNLGLRALGAVAELHQEVTAHDLGYLLGPRINAGSRMGESSLGVKLLSSHLKTEVHKIANVLDQHNKQRRYIEHKTTEEALQNVANHDLLKKKVLIVVEKEWNIGVIGIIASRLKEKYQKPVIIISLVDKIGKCSARSIKGINIGLCFALAVKKGLLIEGGGHAMAAGCNIFENKISEFSDFVENFVNDIYSVDVIYDNAKKLLVDACIKVAGVTKELMENIRLLEPVGQANHRARFYIGKCTVVKAWMVAQKHIIFLIRDYDFIKNHCLLKCVLFNAIGTTYGDEILRNKASNISVVGYLQKNKYHSNQLDFIVEDYCLYEH